MWYNKYVGIPYVDKGRTAEGTDCWGLARLIYKEEYNISLPSFSEEYIPKDTGHIEELINQYEEGWEKLEEGVEGCIVLFNILGHTSHIGVMIDDTRFIHCTRGVSASITSIDLPKWSKRLQGFYKYTSKSSEVFKSEPTPLSVAPLTIEIEEGFTVKEALDAIALNNGLPDRLKSQLVLFIDGVAVTECNNNKIIIAGQKLEYRLLPADDDDLRVVAFVALVVVAAPVAGAVGGAMGTTAASALGLGTLGTNALIYVGSTLATIATMSIGMALVNAVFPVRPPDAPITPGDPGTSNPQLMLQGGRNESRTYSSIPLVLGQYRIIAPVAANSYSQIETDTVYLRMLLCWGYGDIRVDDIRIGPTVISEYDEVTQFTDGNTLATDTGTFDNIKRVYGNDTTQIYPGVELLYTGAETDWVYRNIIEDVTDINVSLHFPEGLRGMYISGSSAGSVFAVSFTGRVQICQLDNDLNEVGSWRAPNTSVQGIELKLTNPYNTYYAYYGGAVTGAVTGPGPHYMWNRVFILNGVLQSKIGPAHLNAFDTTVPIDYGSLRNGGFVYYPPTYVNTVPVLPAGAIPVLDIQVYSNSSTSTVVFQTIVNPDLTTTYGYTLGALSDNFNLQDRRITIPSLVSTITDYTVNYGLANEEFNLRKDAFSTSIIFSNLPKAKYKVRARRTNSHEPEPTTDTHVYTKCVFQAITGTLASTPVVVPKDCSLALTAMKIRATDQLNGSIEGVNALVTSVCWDWFTNSTSNIPLTSTTGSNILTTNLSVPSEYIGSTITGNPLVPNGSTVVDIQQRVTYVGWGWFNSYVSYKIHISNNATGSGTNNTNLIANHWVKRPTRNPASLFRHILQHPANAQRILDADVTSKIDLLTLQEWHEYCATNNFKYDGVITERRSLLEVMKDVAAAGRASPLLVNGKWTVIIDKPRTTIIQQFTPHNSWDFEGSKLLPITPHALRVPFVNSKQEYQIEEQIVYNDVIRYINITTVAGYAVATVSASDSLNLNIGDVVLDPSTLVPAGLYIVSKTETSITFNTGVGILAGTDTIRINSKYNETNAELYETINLPGITESDAVFKHARFHLAQSRLRPEVYTLNADIEHIVCTRGDLVRVVHDTPMWGNGSSRIDYCTTVADVTTVYFKDPINLASGTSYLLRIRDYAGNNTTHNISNITLTDSYTQVNITPALTAQQSESGNLIIIGEVTKDSAELIVIGIEPSSNLTAKLTLADYSPAVYTSDTELIPEFNTKITQQAFFARNYIVEVPEISTQGIKSDESVMEVSGSSFIYKIRVPFIIPSILSKNISHIESRVCLTSDSSKSWRSSYTIPIVTPNLYVLDVTEGLSYSIQSRYISIDGYSGPWSEILDHIVVGKTTLPTQVAGFTCIADVNTGNALLQWSSNTEIDISGYEIRNTDSGWGTGGALYIGKATKALLPCNPAGELSTFYIKAVDTGGRLSVTPSTASITVDYPAAVTSIVASYNDTSNTISDINISWNTPIATSFVIREYIVKVIKPDTSFTTYRIYSDNIKVPANWVGGATIQVTAIDIQGNESAIYSIVSTKLPPSNVVSYSVVPLGTSLEFTWSPAIATTLPIYGYEIRSTDSGWGTETGSFIAKVTSANSTITSFNLGSNTWYLRAIDTDSNYSTTSLILNYTSVVPEAPVFGVPIFSDTSLTNANVTLEWSTITPAFGLRHYKLTYDSQVILTGTTTNTIPADWLGDRVFNVTAIDNRGNESAVRSISVTKLPPNPIPLATFTSQVIDNNILLFWNYPEKTTLPISHAKLRKGITWESSFLIGDVSGTFASIQEVTGAEYTYWISVVDTDNNESTPISLTAKVSQPPDFIFNAKYESTFTGTLVSGAMHQTGGILLPLNTSETFDQHFSTRSWTSPDAQISAGYPIFAQPSAGPGYYEETFDYGNILPSSQVTLTYNGSVISGTPLLDVSLSLSEDNIGFTEYPGSSIFSTSFRYIKVRITVSQSDSGLGLYHLKGLTVTLDSKQKSDGGNTFCNSSDTLGTVHNFGGEFIDITSITVSPNSTTPVIPVYDFRDSVISGTYSASGTSCTITEVGHSLIIGQKVRLYFSSGTAVNGTYIVTSVIDANTYTVGMNVITPTSGNHTSYPNSTRIYLFNTSGIRQSGSVSCSVRGY